MIDGRLNSERNESAYPFLESNVHGRELWRNCIPADKLERWKDLFV